MTSESFPYPSSARPTFHANKHTANAPSDSRSTRNSTSQDAELDMQDQTIVENGPVRLKFHQITPVDRAQPKSHSGRHMQTEQLHQTEWQNQSWGLPDAVAVEL